MSSTGASLPQHEDSASRWLVAVLLLAGVALYGACLPGGNGGPASRLPPQLLGWALAPLALLTPVGRGLLALRRRLNNPRPRSVALATLVISVVSATYFLLSAMHQGRGLEPHFQDEHAYLVQARILARGRLWMPPHPLPQFFDTFYILVRPVYAGINFPGTALIHAIGLRLGLVPAATSALICGACVGLVFRIGTELIDAFAGAIAALLIASLGMFRVFATMTMPHSVMLLLGLLMVWSWLHWRRSQSAGWAIALGSFAGWAAITRPLDALCVALPIGIAMLLRLRRRTARAWIATLAALLFSALPLLSLQIIFNLRVTGHLLDTPWSLYHRQNFPALAYGSRAANLDTPSPSPLPQVRRLYDEFDLPRIRESARESLVHHWFVEIASASRNFPLATALIPVGWLALRHRARWAAWAPLPLLVAAYGGYPIFLDYYLLVALPALVLNILLGWSVIDATFPAAGRSAGNAVALGLIGLSLASLPEINPLVKDQYMRPDSLLMANEQLAGLPQTPAVVLFRLGARSNPHEEPVFNLDVADPDEATIIRAHDLGETEDRKLAAYYARARHEPNRFFYLYDRGTFSLYPMGTAAEGAEGKWRYPEKS